MREIPLTQGFVALIDEDDFLRVDQYKWYYAYNSRNGYGYAVTNVRVSGKQQRLPLHRFIMGARRGEVVDHLNHNTLDNRKNNLRLCSQSVNMHNRKGANKNNKSTGVLGVTYFSKTGKYRSRITVDGKSKSLGLFDTIIQAAERRNSFILNNRLYSTLSIVKNKE